MTCRVSVVLPTRNRLEKLQRALLGVRGQTFSDFELIVVVDGSTDGTLSWLKTHDTGARVLVVDKPVGAAAARNYGVEHARGELIAFLDDDDFWLPSYLERQVAQLFLHPEADLSYSDHIEIDESRREFLPDTMPLLTYESSLVRLLTESFIHTMSVVVCRRSAFDQFGLFDGRLEIVHDLDWYARVLAGNGTFVRVPSILVERNIPGGLVKLQRSWFREEGDVLTQVFENNPQHRKHKRMIRAYRCLFFARLGLVRGDLTFGFARLFEAFLHSVHWTTTVAALRLWRRAQFRRLHRRPAIERGATHDYTR